MDNLNQIDYFTNLNYDNSSEMNREIGYKQGNINKNNQQNAHYINPQNPALRDYNRLHEETSVLEWFLHIFISNIVIIGFIYKVLMIFTIKDNDTKKNLFIGKILASIAMTTFLISLFLLIFSRTL